MAAEWSVPTEPPPKYGDPYHDRDSEDSFELRVQSAVDRLKVRKAAEAIVRAESEPTAPPFDAGSLADILARPAEPDMRVAGLIPWASSALIVAQRKTGKTTLLLNYANALITGDDFLGQFPVQPVTGRIAILNFEVSAAMLARWAADVDIDPDRLYLVNLRGRRNPFTHPEDREHLAQTLRSQAVEALIVDPFSRAYTGASQNDSGEVGSFLSDLDRFARAEAGATDLILAAHAGWNGERTRGSSALEDWADVIITLTRDDTDDGNGARFIRAVGRDVDLDEDRLEIDQHTRRLTMTGAGSRRQATTTRKVDVLIPIVINIVNTTPGLGVNEIRARVKVLREEGTVNGRDGEVNKAVAQALDRGLIRAEQHGQKRAHYPTEAHQGPTEARPHPATEATEAIRASVPVTPPTDTQQPPTRASVQSPPKDTP